MDWKDEQAEIIARGVLLAKRELDEEASEGSAFTGGVLVGLFVLGIFALGVLFGELGICKWLAGVLAG